MSSSCVSIFKAAETGRKIAEGVGMQDRGSPAADVEQDATSCSSSIGSNSDCSGGQSTSSGTDGDDSEVQSSYKCPLDTMDALEDCLPVGRGISKFYHGKSKSFTSLADAAASSAKDLGKPENPHNRKRKNLLACSAIWDRNHSHSLRNRVPRKPADSSRSTLSTPSAMSSCESNRSEKHQLQLPPLPPHGKSSLNKSMSQWPFPSRSFSLTDLQEGGTSSSIIQHN